MNIYFEEHSFKMAIVISNHKGYIHSKKQINQFGVPFL